MRIVNYVVDNGYKFVWEFGNGKWNIIMVLFWKFLYDNKFKIVIFEVFIFECFLKFWRIFINW